MKRLAALAVFVFSVACNPQTKAGVEEILSFKLGNTGEWPGGWGGAPTGTVFLDDKVIHGGNRSARFERRTDSSNDFSSLVDAIPIDFSGKEIEIRGYLRTQDVKGFVGLWMREDGEDHQPVAFDNMQGINVQGTSDWKEYSITLPVRQEAKQLFFGVLLGGTGQAWAADLRLLVDGKPVWNATPAVRTVLDDDHQFDRGSGLSFTGLTAVQVDNLATLGKVWGFVKYHHPLVTSGKRHFDYDLFRVLPSVVGAPDRASANAAILRWIDDLGPVGDCKSCTKLEESDLELRPGVHWISDEARFGKALSERLQAIHRNRPKAAAQFYVSLKPMATNPSFDHELPYAHIKLPDAGYQLLGLYRFWNIIEYWYPNRDILGEDWDKVLAQLIPRIALAKDADSYQLELMAAIARVHDTHANLWSSLAVRPPVGQCDVPAIIRFVENQAVVTEARAEPLKTGDAIDDIDGTAVTQLVANWSPYYADSNDAARMRDVARSLLRGSCGAAKLRVQRQSGPVDFEIQRVKPSSQANSWHDLPGPAFRLLSSEVAYLKLSSVKNADAAHYVEGAAGTKGLIIDIRNYPSEFMVFALGSLLVSHKTDFVRFTTADISNPGAFYWTKPETLTPSAPHYSGKVVILVDEVSQSQAEYTTMAFRSAPDAVVLGSTTAGADGDVSPIPLPGGYRTMISGIGVFYPDKRPTQRVGIIPDVVVRPTIAGIRAGRDEVLEAGIRQILGTKVSDSEIRSLIKP